MSERLPKTGLKMETVFQPSVTPNIFSTDYHFRQRDIYDPAIKLKIQKTQDKLPNYLKQMIIKSRTDGYIKIYVN